MNAADTTSAIYQILTADAGVAAVALTGGIYVDQRPFGSTKEDIVINSLVYSHGNPATAVSNINVYVPDIPVNIGWREQKVKDTDRMAAISAAVIAAINTAKVSSCTLRVANETAMEVSEAELHANNIRVNWNIAAHE